MSRKIQCNLITGQEKIFYKDAKFLSCTIEIGRENFYQQAIIDQIQMIGDQQRGKAWTKAVLRTNAKVVHLCGNSKALGLIQKILQKTGDDLQQRKYQRLSKLNINLKLYDINQDLRKGDCFISFQSTVIRKFRTKINEITGQNSTGILYGRLPAQVRKAQAKVFNNKGFKYLIASNAIGMGLNFQILRIIFISCNKKNADGTQGNINEQQIRQIAGRAGRGNVDGEVCCINKKDLKRVKKALNTNQQIIKEQYNFSKKLNRYLTESQKSIKRAALFVDFNKIKQIKGKLQKNRGKITMTQTFKFKIDSIEVQQIYFLEKSRAFLQISQQLERFQMSQQNHYTWSIAPLSLNKKTSSTQCFFEFAVKFKNNESIRIPQNIKNSIDTMQCNMLSLRDFQDTHHLMQVYIWLSKKYPSQFIQSLKAKYYKDIICNKISSILQNK